jgi:chaperone required for assembly of F1-ATPase
VICLAIALSLMNFFSSESFNKDLNDIFAANVKTMKWCPDHTVDFQWMESDASFSEIEKWKTKSADEIKNNFCAISMDASEVKSPTKEFKPLLMAQSAEAKTVLLEWNPLEKLFRVQGIIFASQHMADKLNQK